MDKSSAILRRPLKTMKLKTFRRPDQPTQNCPHFHSCNEGNSLIIVYILRIDQIDSRQDLELPGKLNRPVRKRPGHNGLHLEVDDHQDAGPDETRGIDEFSGSPFDAPVGARLLLHRLVREVITSDPWILEAVSSGFRIPFETTPPLSSMVMLSLTPSANVMATVRLLIEKKVLEVVPPIVGPSFYSSIFVVSKKTGDQIGVQPARPEPVRGHTSFSTGNR